MDLTDKKTILEQAQYTYPTYKVIVNTQQMVHVPKHIEEPLITLELGIGLAIPVKDIEIDLAGFSCTLSFNRVPFKVFVSWDGLVGILTKDYNLTWPIPPSAVARKPKLHLC